MINKCKPAQIENDAMMKSDEVDDIIENLVYPSISHLRCVNIQLISFGNVEKILRSKNQIQDKQFIIFTCCEYSHYIFGIILPNENKCFLCNSLSEYQKNEYIILCKKLQQHLNIVSLQLFLL